MLKDFLLSSKNTEPTEPARGILNMRTYFYARGTWYVHVLHMRGIRLSGLLTANKK